MPIPIGDAAYSPQGRLGLFGAGLGFILGNLGALVMAAVGMYFGYTSWRLVQSGRTTTGTVTALDESSDSDSAASYAPIVEYRVGSHTYSFNTRNYSSPPAYHAGQQVSVLYDAENPATARINNVWELWLLPGLMCPGAIALAVAMNWMVVLLFRRRARDRAG